MYIDFCNALYVMRIVDLVLITNLLYFLQFTIFRAQVMQALPDCIAFERYKAGGFKKKIIIII